MDIRPARKRPVSKPTPRPQPVFKPLQKKKRRSKQALKKMLVRHAILLVNLAVVSAMIFVVIKNRGGNAADFAAAVRDEVQTSPLDRLSSADIAVNAARMAGLSESAAVTNYADTINSELEAFSVSRDIAFAPVIMSSDIKTLADIQEYTVQPGDTVAGLATRFGVTSDSIRWSNDLLGEELVPGIRILIPPMNGIIYTVRAGDTPERIAGIYRVPVSSVVAFNDAEVGGLTQGQRIFIPNGQKPAPVFSFYARYGNNGYDIGYCTYYAAAKTGAPPGWGHAKSWAERAAQTPGWLVDKVPVRGAIAQTTGLSYWGHVAVIEDVKTENGRYFIKYSDMNNLAGWNRVGYSDWEPAEVYQAFIYRIN